MTAQRRGKKDKIPSVRLHSASDTIVHVTGRTQGISVCFAEHAQRVPRQSSIGGLTRMKPSGSFLYNYSAHFGRSGETAYATHSKCVGETHGGSNPPSGTSFENLADLSGFCSTQ